MNEQINKTLGPLKQFWTNLSASVKKMIIGGVTVTIIFALVMSFILNSKEYVVIFDQLNQSETAEILAQLQTMDVSVKLDNAGSIMVLKEDESNVRMTLATAGYPKSGLSYYLIEQGSGMLTTDYQKEQYVNMQLQERIAAGIKTLEGVKDAIVTITVPRDNVFYLQDKEEPTASVILHMMNGYTISDGQVKGIQNLVVKSVLGLKRENVAISDGSGNNLSGDSSSSSAELSKINITREIENDIKKKILSVLVGPYENAQFRVSVTATVDVDDLIKEETLYSPSRDGNNSGVIKEETKSEETSSSLQGDGGIAGTTSNSEVPTYPTDASNGESTYTSTSESTKYQVSQVVSQFQKSGARIESVSIGIAIDKPSFSTGEKESITRLVAFAVGVTAESITVENFDFFEEKESSVTPEEVPVLNKMFLYGGAAAGLLLLIGVILIIVLGKKKRKKKKGSASSAASNRGSMSESLDDLFGQPAEPIPPIRPVQDARREEVKDFAKTNPEIAAQMLKSWLRNDSE